MKTEIILRALTLIACITILVLASQRVEAARITISYDAPFTRENGQVLYSNEIDHYKVFIADMNTAYYRVITTKNTKVYWHGYDNICVVVLAVTIGGLYSNFTDMVCAVV